MRLCRPNFCSLAASLLLSLPGASPFSASRRQVFSAGAGLLSSRLFKPLDADAVINGASVSKAEAAAAGAVGLWIDLANCTVCRHDVPAACSGTLISEDLVLSAKHCLDIPEELNGTLSRVVFSNSLFDKAAESSPVAAFRIAAELGGAGAARSSTPHAPVVTPVGELFHRISLDFSPLYLLRSFARLQLFPRGKNSDLLSSSSGCGIPKNVAKRDHF